MAFFIVVFITYGDNDWKNRDEEAQLQSSSAALASAVSVSIIIDHKTAENRENPLNSLNK